MVPRPKLSEPDNILKRYLFNVDDVSIDKSHEDNIFVSKYSTRNAGENLFTYKILPRKMKLLLMFHNFLLILLLEQAVLNKTRTGLSALTGSLSTSLDQSNVGGPSITVNNLSDEPFIFVLLNLLMLIYL